MIGMIRNWLDTLRVFKRLRELEARVTMLSIRCMSNTQGVEAINEFIDSREPCKTCGHHRYRRQTARAKTPVTQLSAGKGALHDRRVS